MPTYLYECPNHGEFEESHSIKTVLETCPQCKAENIDPPNAVRRLINCSSKGTVELTGHELESKTKEDIRKLKSDMGKSDKVYANLLGEQTYHEMQTKMDRRKR